MGLYGTFPSAVTWPGDFLWPGEWLLFTEELPSLPFDVPTPHIQPFDTPEHPEIGIAS